MTNLFLLKIGLELGIAETNLMKAIALSTGRSMAQIKSDNQTLGDLGLVAEQSKANQRMIFNPSRLTIKTVFEKLKEIAHLSGHSVNIIFNFYLDLDIFFSSLRPKKWKKSKRCLWHVKRLRHVF